MTAAFWANFVYVPGWTGPLEWMIIVAFVLAFAVSYGMGANDACNDWGTSVGAGTVKLWQAYVLCAIFNVIGALLLGYKVTNTIRESIVDVNVYNVYSQYNSSAHSYNTVANCSPLSNITYSENMPLEPPVDCARYTSVDFIQLQLGALAGVAVFMIVSSIMKMPVSATHAIVGATVASSLYLRGNHGIRWAEIGGIVVSWFVSPVLAGIVASIIYIIVKFTVFYRKDPFKSALQMCPIYMTFTIAINLFACIYDGSKYLGFDKLNVWQAAGISGAIGIIVGLILNFPMRKWLTNRAIYLYNKDVAKGRVRGEPVPKLGGPAGSTVVPIGLETNGTNNNGFPTPGKLEKQVSVYDHPWHHYLYSPIHEDHKAAKVFNALQMVSASLLSFSHGANDTGNTVGPLVAIWLTYKAGYALVPADTRDDMQLLLGFGAFAMLIGFVTLGHRTMKLIAKEITTDVSAPSGFAVELGTAFTVLFCAKVGIPVSSTHCAVGAVLFVGMTKDTTEGVSWRVFSKVVFFWLLCFPMSAVISLGVTVLFHTFL